MVTIHRPSARALTGLRPDDLPRGYRCFSVQPSCEPDTDPDRASSVVALAAGRQGCRFRTGRRRCQRGGVRDAHGSDAGRDQSARPPGLHGDPVALSAPHRRRNRRSPRRCGRGRPPVCALPGGLSDRCHRDDAGGDGAGPPAHRAGCTSGAGVWRSGSPSRAESAWHCPRVIAHRGLGMPGA